MEKPQRNLNDASSDKKSVVLIDLNGDRVTTKNTRKEITLTITNATESDAGKYICEGYTLLNRFKPEFDLKVSKVPFNDSK